MTWTRLSDDFMERPEMYLVSRDARLLHIEAMVWCNRNLTDGALPATMLRRVTDAEDLDKLVAELEDAEAWTRHADGWRLDWSEQETGELVRERKAAAGARQRRFRERKERHERGDHSLCDPRFCSRATSATRDVTRDVTPPETRDVTRESQNPYPTRPVPSRPEGPGTGTEGGPAAADASPDRLQPHPFAGHGVCCELPRHHPIHTEGEPR